MPLRISPRRTSTDGLVAFEIGFHHVVVLLDGKLQHVVTPFVGLLLQLGPDRLADPGGAQIFALIDPLFHGHQVDDAFQLVFGPDRQLHRHRLGTGAIRDHLDAVEEVGAGLVHLVDEDDPRNLVAVGLTPDGFGLRLNARVAVEQHHRAVEHGQRTLDLDREVHVAGGVDDVEAVLVVLRQIAGIDGALPEGGRGGGGDGDAAFLLLLHPVHRRGAIMHLADLVGLAGVEQDPLGRRGLARVDMGNDPEVTVAGQGVFACHWSASGLNVTSGNG